MKFKIVLIWMVCAVVGVTWAAAQGPQPTPPPASGYFPRATPNPADVIVLTPTPSGDRVQDILNSPGVLTPGPTFVPPPDVPPGFLQPGATALVTAGPLNVRTVPSTRAGSTIIGQLQQGEDVTILTLSPDLNWAQVDTRGPLFTTGWVSTQYISTLENFQPFAPSLPDQAGTGLRLRAQQTVNIRSAPVLFSDRVGILPAGTEAEIIGRKSTYSWWKIKVDGATVGWVAAEYVYVIDNAAYQQAPVLVE